MDLIIIKEGKDNRGYELQTTQCGDFTIERLRSPRAGTDGEFVPSRVLYKDKVVWSFAHECKVNKFHGMAFLREIDGELVIMFCDKRRLYDVVSIRDLAWKYLHVEMKEALAIEEGLEPIWTEQEAALRDAGNKAVPSTEEAEEPSPAATTKTPSLPVTVVEITVKDKEEKVLLAASIDEIRGLCDQGINDCSLAMCPKAGGGERYTVFSITKGKKIRPVTEVLYTN